MEKARRFKKRPCRICHRWFRPDPRVGNRQRTCGKPTCKREWHRKKCAQWNRNNEEYFKAIYLKNKVATADQAPDRPDSKDPPLGQDTTSTLLPRLDLKLPRLDVQEVIGIKELVIIEYIVQLLFNRFQELIKAKLTVNTG